MSDFAKSFASAIAGALCLQVPRYDLRRTFFLLHQPLQGLYPDLPTPAAHYQTPQPRAHKLTE